MPGPTKTTLNLADMVRLCVFVVDDNEHMRVLIRRLLVKLGVDRIFEHASASDALNEVSDRKPSLIFTDLSMEDMDGIEFTRALRRRTRASESEIPIVMVTGHTERQHIERARDAGVNEILAKPITVGGLTNRIEEIVLRPRPFVRTPVYIGPCRRRRYNPNYAGPWRRKEDEDMVLIETPPELPNESEPGAPTAPAKRAAR
jgi:CheY-like chemotaxis protein